MPNSPPPLRRHCPLQVVSEPVGSIWIFGLTAVEPPLFRVVGIDTSRPPHFDGPNFPYYKARMACHLEAVDLGPQFDLGPCMLVTRILGTQIEVLLYMLVSFPTYFAHFPTAIVPQNKA